MHSICSLCLLGSPVLNIYVCTHTHTHTHTYTHTHIYTVLSHSVMSDDSWQPQGLQPARLLCLLGFSRQEHWSGLPCPPPRDLPNPVIEPRYSALQVDSLPAELPGKPIHTYTYMYTCVYIYIYIYPHIYRVTSGHQDRQGKDQQPQRCR